MNASGAPDNRVTKVKSLELVFWPNLGGLLVHRTSSMAGVMRWRTMASRPKNKGATDFSVAPRLVPSPRYFAKSNYCNCGHVALLQVACATIGGFCPP